MINTVVEFIRAKHIRPSCKRLPDDTLSTDLNSALQDETTINSARRNQEISRRGHQGMKEQHNAITRSTNKEKAREMLEKKWDRFFIQPHKVQNDPKMSSVISYGSNVTEASTTQKQQVTSYGSNIPELPTMQRPPVTRYGADISKEELDNIPTFDGKQGELSQFLNTFEPYSTMYRVHEADLVLLRSRGKAHEIISHAIAEDLDVEWSDIKRKLMSNYGSTQSRIEASVKISKLSMSSDETVGEYLTGARTLIKSKIKNIAMWHTEFDEADAYHMCNRLLKTGLKSRILRRVSQFKTYTNFFDHIKDKWERSYFMEDDFAEQNNTQSTTAEVDKIYTLNKAIPVDQTEADMLVEVNEVYHRYGRYPSQCDYWAPGPRPQGTQAPFRGGQGGQKPHFARHSTPKHQNTTIANQAYTFNGTTPHACVSYAPGTFNMGAPFSTHHQVPYGHQPSQQQTQPSQQRFNSFAQEQSNHATQADLTVMLLD